MPATRPATWRLHATLLLAAGLLLGLAAWVPAGGWQWQVGGQHYQLRYPTLAQLLDYSPPQPPQADTVLKNILADGLLPNALDSAQATRKTKLPPDSFAVAANSRIWNPEKNEEYALDNFFEALQALDQGALPATRIAHYGDSQIEGDRITGFIRMNMQRRFGGKGFGLVPIFEQAVHFDWTTDYSDNWKRYTVFQNLHHNNDYGLHGAVFRYSKRSKPDSSWQGQKDSSEAMKIRASKAHLKFRIEKYASYDRLVLLWGNSAQPCLLQVLQNDSTLWQDTLRAAAGLQATTLPIKASLDEVTLRFTGESPDVYGLLVDGNRGVQVDNLALRGHSGNGLARIRAGYLQQQVQLLGTRLFVFQYGGNVIPYAVKDSTYSWLEKDVYDMLLRYKRLAPEASLLLIGVGDMAYKQDEQWQSYANVPLVRDAQLRAARRAGVAFWDLYKVMGGQGAIVAWAENEPPLAAEDYAHFSFYGQRLIADQLYKALMNEYAAYRKRQLQRARREMYPKKPA